MSTNIRPIKSQGKQFTNSPVVANPTATVSVPLADLIALGAAQATAAANQPRFDDGYRRYLHCDTCETQASIFTCWHGSPKSCNGAKPTHTHITCKCDRSEPIVFSGSVKFRTKQDDKKSGEVATPVVESTE